MAKFAVPAHKKAARGLGHALTLNDFEGWDDLTTILAVRLSDRERASLAWAALRALEPEHASAVAQSVLEAAGYPLPTFLKPMDDARWWADIANRRERKAYALASFEAMNSADRRAFLGHIGEGRAAA